MDMPRTLAKEDSELQRAARGDPGGYVPTLRPGAVDYSPVASRLLNNRLVE
jgi:hypothetical protein